MGFIRLLLALAVFNSHFPLLEDLPIVDGHEAVLTFFAISGFYMALILDTAYATPRQFYRARIASLYPPYLFALALSLALLLLLGVHPYTTRAALASFLADPLSLLLWAWTSLTLLGQDLFFCLSRAADGSLHFVSANRDAVWRQLPLVQTWSLSLEAVFYALAPFLVRLKNRTLLGLVAASLGIKLFVFFGPAKDVGFFIRFFPAEFWLFGCGILAYRAYARLPKETLAFDYLAAALLAGSIFVADLAPDGLEPFCLPLAALVTIPFVFRAFGGFSADRAIGKISYPFYLLHFTAIALFEKFLEEPAGWHILLCTLAGAVLTHLFFSQGVKRLKHTLPLRPFLPVAPAPAPAPLKVPGGMS
ncbi:MAG: acyltransferase family protein [Pseudodesulfovibrio sp.]